MSCRKSCRLLCRVVCHLLIFMSLTSIQQESLRDELRWYISSVVRPEFAQLVETLDICRNLLRFNSPQRPDASARIERGPAIKLPVSTPRLEALKGIVVRDGTQITELSVRLKDSHFKTHNLRLIVPMDLPQLVTAAASIDTALAVLKELASDTKTNDDKKSNDRNVEKNLNDNDKNNKSLNANGSKNMNDNNDFKNDDNHIDNANKCEHFFSDLETPNLERFRCLREHVHVAKKALQLATDPALVFPLHAADDLHFDPPLNNIAVDLYVNQAEVCVDLKHLVRITESPWSAIDSNGVSYIDRIRDEMKLPSSHASPGAGAGSSGPLNAADIETRLKELVDVPTPTLSSVMSHLTRPRLQPIDYVTKCVTYRNSVVMVNCKVEASTPDPVLVSVFTKLDSIEYLVGSFLDNLECLEVGEKKE